MSIVRKHLLACCVLVSSVLIMTLAIPKEAWVYKEERQKWEAADPLQLSICSWVLCSVPMGEVIYCKGLLGAHVPGYLQGVLWKLFVGSDGVGTEIEVLE